MKLRTMGLVFAWVALSALARAQDASNEVLVHEWGTFTSLQDESGNAVGGINTDDEPVPNFVHDVARMLLLSPTEVPPVFFQGAPSCHPDVTMRLETPVLYFHAPPDFRGRVDVSVAFQGGWLTQFYPQATATTPGIDLEQGHYDRLTLDTVGKLAWSGLAINAGATGPSTDERVWLSPRAVSASGLQTPDGETERFLFYRGVGHRDAPVRVVRSGDAKTLALLPGATPFQQPLVLEKLWLVEIRADGKAAYRSLDPVTLDGSSGAASATSPAFFPPAAYTAEAVNRLRTDLKTALVAAGLFGDEADALLNTWEISYFKSPGLRLFFLVPQAWTDAVLPLQISGVPPATRVMVGRIELVTPQQRALLAKMAAGPVPDPWSDFRQKLEAVTIGSGRAGEWNALFDGRKTFAEVGFHPPGTYQDYLDLGRFRNALLLDEARRTRNETLNKFIKTFGLTGYKVPMEFVSQP